MWTKKQPKIAGEYHIAGRDGEFHGIRALIEHNGEIIDPLELTGRRWRNWWWSIPIIFPPSPPLW